MDWSRVSLSKEWTSDWMSFDISKDHLVILQLLSWQSQLIESRILMNKSESIKKGRSWLLTQSRLDSFLHTQQI